MVVLCLVDVEIEMSFENNSALFVFLQTTNLLIQHGDTFFFFYFVLGGYKLEFQTCINIYIYIFCFAL